MFSRGKGKFFGLELTTNYKGHSDVRVQTNIVEVCKVSLPTEQPHAGYKGGQ